jgi:hypothetical protein
LWDFWVRPVRAEPVAAFRILLAGTGLLSALLSIAPDLELFLGREGLCQASAEEDWLKRNGSFCLVHGAVTVPPAFQEYLLSEEAGKKVKDWETSATARAWKEGFEEPRQVYLVFWMWIASLVLMMVGLGTRLVVFVAWALSVTFFNRLSWTNNGGDALFVVAMFYLLFARCGAVWSLDAWLLRTFRRKRFLRAGKSPEEAAALRSEPVCIPAWPVRLMQIQLVILYLCTGLAKLGEQFLRGLFSLCNEWVAGRFANGLAEFAQGVCHEDSQWLNGEAVYQVLNDISLTRWPWCAWPLPLLVCRLLSWSTLLFEIGFPLFVLFRRVRPWLLLCGVLFHTGIWFHTEVGYFSPVTLCWYVLFLRGDTLASLVQWLAPRRAGPAGGEDSRPLSSALTPVSPPCAS